jgi:hypothetical protein
MATVIILSNKSRIQQMVIIQPANQPTDQSTNHATSQPNLVCPERAIPYIENLIKIIANKVF